MERFPEPVGGEQPLERRGRPTLSYPHPRSRGKLPGVRVSAFAAVLFFGGCGSVKEPGEDGDADADGDTDADTDSDTGVKNCSEAEDGELCIDGLCREGVCDDQSCFIGGAWFSDGDVDPTSGRGCQVCDVERSRSQWSSGQAEDASASMEVDAWTEVTPCQICDESDYVCTSNPKFGDAPFSDPLPAGSVLTRVHVELYGTRAAYAGSAPHFRMEINGEIIAEKDELEPWQPDGCAANYCNEACLSG